MDNCGKSSLSRKCDRKQKRCQHIVEKETGIKCTLLASKSIAICNAGLVNGLSEETVYQNFIEYGPIDNITMVPGKSCCFIRFKNIESASRAFENINGKLNIGQNNKPVYLSYVESIPNPKPIYQNKMPPGLIVIEDFISETEESILMELCNFNEQENGSMKHRHVKHFGYEFRYDINNVNKDKPLEDKMPQECDFLWERLKLRHIEFKPDQLTVNCYKPGQGIPPHIDTHSAFEDPIISLSLGSSVVMNFKNENISMPVVLPRRSLTIMSSESRYAWIHGITPRKLDIIPTQNDLSVIHRSTRISYTFRKIRHGECDCQYTQHCDSYAKRLKSKSNSIKNKEAMELETTHVYDVYDIIALHFSDTRCKPWPNVLKFLHSLEVGSILIDVGCGNGKYLGCVPNVFSLGCDRSFGLAEVAGQRGFEVFSCNCLNIPIRDNTADGCISIAVIHHLANEERRLQAIEEMARVLKIGGRCLIYVWATDQQRNQQKTSYLKQDRKNRKENGVVVPEQPTENVSVTGDITLPVHQNRTQFQHQDLLVPWKLKAELAPNNEENVFLRFYHVFVEGELERLCSQLDYVKIVKYYYDQGNWCCIFEKTK
ncbi:methyltransferase [Oryctes borbonicus]|uniref:tRNA (carboxymethyluridine(34)-5-O)-methyltransferase n=1 Tax=Oryctes borbonicus TaxID=1629725 RepID=A0A0T6AXC8_9SCAR|nr:methyltransferase [Oryctes borbonicus]